MKIKYETSEKKEITKKAKNIIMGTVFSGSIFRLFKPSVFLITSANLVDLKTNISWKITDEGPTVLNYKELDAEVVVKGEL